jgi:hypothetical protein
VVFCHGVTVNRRSILRTSAWGVLSALVPVPWRVALAEPTRAKLRAATTALQAAGTDPVHAVLAGRPYAFDPAVLFPTKTGIVDPDTGHSFYFHAHRAGEYGHFHTFSRDEYGLSVHLVMISMDRTGRPTALSTVNQWVTGDRHLKAPQLTPLLDRFNVSPASFVQPALVSFVTELIKSHRAVIVELFKERDQWVEAYRDRTGSVPYEDISHEVLSTRPIDSLG